MALNVGQHLSVLAVFVLGDTVKKISERSPVAALMPLFFDVLNVSPWDQDTYSLPACVACIAVFAFVRILWDTAKAAGLIRGTPKAPPFALLKTYITCLSCS
ncbi:MAG TPA: hypothetical protein VIM40_08860 [Arthrobacter sp.]